MGNIFWFKNFIITRKSKLSTFLHLSLSKKAPDARVDKLIMRMQKKYMQENLLLVAPSKIIIYIYTYQ